jgi:hypothetical protein
LDCVDGPILSADLRKLNRGVVLSVVLLAVALGVLVWFSLFRGSSPRDWTLFNQRDLTAKDLESLFPRELVPVGFDDVPEVQPLPEMIKPPPGPFYTAALARGREHLAVMIFITGEGPQALEGQDWVGPLCQRYIAYAAAACPVEVAVPGGAGDSAQAMEIAGGGPEPSARYEQFIRRGVRVGMYVQADDVQLRFTVQAILMTMDERIQELARDRLKLVH